MTSQQVNPDLISEREGSSFNSELLTNILDGSLAKTRRRRYLENLAQSDPVYGGTNAHFQSRDDAFSDGVKKYCHVYNKAKEYGLSLEDFLIYDSATKGSQVWSLTMHFFAFLPALEMQGDAEQVQKWGTMAKNLEIIGCYCQTELGHGTFVRGLETRADYDPKTQEFVLNSPTLTSTKWWVGALGVCATHALVVAQLYTNGKFHGLHPFMVQVRSLETHKPMPGVTVGDIGPKLGFPAMDNGFLRMNNVKIPRDNLLRKTGMVRSDGTYVKPTNDKLVYGGMLGLRSRLPSIMARLLAQAVTIATRYSCVRHQSELKAGQGEPPVLDYQTQQHKILPLLASAYGFIFVGNFLQYFHSTVIEEMNAGNFKRLPELIKRQTFVVNGASSYGIFLWITQKETISKERKDHCLCAGVKALLIWRCQQGVEICRLACGGHGYSHASGLPQIYSLVTANSTAEGETTILLLQTVRYLLKCLMKIQAGKPLDPSTAYLANQDACPSVTSSAEPATLLRLFEIRSARMLTNVGERMQRLLLQDGLSQDDAINRSTVPLVEVAKAYIDVVLVRAFVDKVRELETMDKPIAAVMRRLCQIYTIYTLLEAAGDFLQYECTTASQLDLLRDALYALYAQVRPDAVSLVDAFDFTDYTLDSVLGRYDGQVYEHLYEWAKKAPLNKTEVHESYHKYLKPLRDAKL